MLKRILSSLLLILFGNATQSQVPASAQQPPMKIAIVGLVHTHVHWILGRMDDGDFEIVGIVEPNRELAQRYAKQYGYSMDLVYDTIDDLLDNTQPQAVTAFNTIRGHLEVVEKYAPRGIHVMVEKPLAVSLAHAQQMEALAKKHNIHLLTNYETTWYGTNLAIKEQLEAKPEAFGPIRKIVIHDGHPGPYALNINKEFLEWLIDPYWNGAGALTDFGCYGANLSTWLLEKRPTSVTAITQQIRPDLYPEVDDEATIILTYPEGQAIIQASWNWNYNRKDMEVYTANSYLHSLNREDLEVMKSEEEGPKRTKIAAPEKPYHDPFSYFMAVIRAEITVKPYDLSALENNMTVMEILDAAMRSAKEGKTIYLR
ncbi:MAG: Gfo/Idh/MocA family oxidoreductase [Bacteroidota bacterium]